LGDGRGKTERRCDGSSGSACQKFAAVGSTRHRFPHARAVRGSRCKKYDLKLARFRRPATLTLPLTLRIAGIYRWQLL
jgi:hypothetical protein